jgi:hypothetical protein
LAAPLDKKLAIQTLFAQAGVVVTGVALVFLMEGLRESGAFAAGGFVAWVNLALLYWRMVYCDKPTLNAEQHLRLMYRSSVERFFVVAGLLAIGFIKLKLNAWMLLLGFLVGQLALVVIPIIRGNKVKNGK